MTATAEPASPTSAAHAFKVLVAGAFAVGKSTLIRQVSDAPVVGTEVATSGAEADVKETTTVGMEFGSFTVDAGDEAIELLLYGLPGQERFSFMWDIVARGADGYLVLVDATDAASQAEGRSMVDRIRAEGTVPVLVAINRASAAPEAADALAAALAVDGIAATRCEAAAVESARAAVVELLLLVLEQMEPDEEAAWT